MSIQRAAADGVVSAAVREAEEVGQRVAAAAERAQPAEPLQGCEDVIEGRGIGSAAEGLQERLLPVRVACHVAYLLSAGDDVPSSILDTGSRWRG